MQDHQYSQHWNSKFSNKQWGRYPAEDLVRFIGRNYKFSDRSNTNILEVGCGPGANIWFLHREGYKTFGIDGSEVAIEQAKKRIEMESAQLNLQAPDLRLGNFSQLPWDSNFFDCVVDVFSVYANPRNIIDETVEEIYRVLKPDGLFFCKLWGTGCTGYGTGVQVEPYTYDGMTVGPCAGMGLTHFFDISEIGSVYEKFKAITLDKVTRTDGYSDSIIEEYTCVFKKSR